MINIKTFKNLAGQTFGRLTALYRLHNVKDHRTRWLCTCECGNLVEVKQMDLHRGSTRSCGCYKKEISKMLHTIHGKRDTQLYHTWQAMKKRCYNKKCKNYIDYGGRGILVCDEWLNNFQMFYAWAMENGYQENLTIDRIDNNKGYSPDNCRWITMKHQNRNKRSNKFITINGETHCLKEWCEILGLKYVTIQRRIKYLNWPIEQALELEERCHD